MKKLSERQRRRLIYYSQRAHRTRRQHRVGFIFSAEGAEQVLLPGNARPMPENFCVFENTEETFKFLNALRDRLLRPPVSGIRAVSARLKGRGSRGAPRWIGRYIDFTTIKYISAASALILAAEYDRARAVRAQSTKEIGRLFVVDPHLWAREVFDKLVSVGFFDILRIANTDVGDSNPDERVLRFRSGKQSDPVAISEMLDDLGKMFQDVGLNADDACFELNGALGEAMENAVRCAYPADRPLRYPHVGRWWMTGALSRSTRRMQVAIFDQGVSIPGSLSDWKFYEGFLARFKRAVGLQAALSEPKYDGTVIEIAIEESATSTMLEKHGKGLGHIKAFVDSCTSGRLTIISRNGFYMYEKGRKPVVKSLAVNIGGTLVEWDVRI